MGTTVLFTASSNKRVALRKRLDYRGERAEFIVSAERYPRGGNTEVHQQVYSRDEAARLHRQLGLLLKATAPPKPKRRAAGS